MVFGLVREQAIFLVTALLSVSATKFSLGRQVQIVNNI